MTDTPTTPFDPIPISKPGPGGRTHLYLLVLERLPSWPELLEAGAESRMVVNLMRPETATRLGFDLDPRTTSLEKTQETLRRYGLQPSNWHALYIVQGDSAQLRDLALVGRNLVDDIERECAKSSQLFANLHGGLPGFSLSRVPS